MQHDGLASKCLTTHRVRSFSYTYALIHGSAKASLCLKEQTRSEAVLYAMLISFQRYASSKTARGNLRAAVGREAKIESSALRAGVTRPKGPW
jgi:hypothetical protein